MGRVCRSGGGGRAGGKWLRQRGRIHRTRCEGDAHLTGSRKIFQHLVEKVRTLDRAPEQAFIAARDYEGLELLILKHFLGVR